MIGEQFDKLMRSCAKICKNEYDRDLIKRAFFLAKEAHEGVRRRSGEPYIVHPLAVARIVVDEIGLGVKSVIAALLHDVVEDTDYTVEDIESRFGPKIALMVDGLTKMSGVFKTSASEQAENFRKMLLTLSDDVRWNRCLRISRLKSPAKRSICSLRWLTAWGCSRSKANWRICR